jgi:DNA-binding GntR family transcriptional regulator
MDETLNPAETRDPAAAPEGRIVRRTLHDEVVSRVRDMIIEGVLAPGTRIHEGQVCGRLGVSRTPLREALKALASEGLVDLVPSRGAVVHRFSSKDVEDMLTVLGTLEALAGRLACASTGGATGSTTSRPTRASTRRSSASPATRRSPICTTSCSRA